MSVKSSNPFTKHTAESTMELAELEIMMKQAIEDFEKNDPNVERIDKIIHILPHHAGSLEVKKRDLMDKIFKIFAVYATSKSFNLIIRRGLQRLIVARQSGWSQKHLYEITLLEKANAVPDSDDMLEFIEFLKTITKTEFLKITPIMLERLKIGFERYSSKLMKLHERFINAIYSMSKRAAGNRSITGRSVTLWSEIGTILQREMEDQNDTSELTELGKKAELSNCLNRSKNTKFHPTEEGPVIGRPTQLIADDNNKKGEILFKLFDSFVRSIISAKGRISKVNENTLQEWEYLAFEISDISQEEWASIRLKLREACTLN